MSTRIPLTRGMVATIDADLYTRVSRHTWHAYKSGRRWYAATNLLLPDGRRKTLTMHRYVWQLLGRDMKLRVEHKSHDGLDNRRANLKVMKSAPAKFLGVSREGGRCLASITIDGKVRRLGLYKSRFSAAWVYNEAARKHGLPLNELVDRRKAGEQVAGRGTEGTP